MDLHAVHFLQQEQGNCSLEDHTRDFLDLSRAYLTHFPDHSLWVFLHTGLNEWSKSRLPVEGPRPTFTIYVEWVLVQNDSPFTVYIADEDNTGPTPDPETSQPSAMPAMEQPKPAMK